MYVTDYTARKDLAPVPATSLWTRDLGDDQIVKILVTETPAEVAKTLAEGDYIAMRKVRLKAASNCVSGRLGGDEQLIFKLKPEESGNTNLVALLR